MRSQLFDRINALERENAVFAIATVVSRQAPVSSHLGDHALVLADGHMEGFVGGSCSRDIVRRQALAAIANRQPLLLQIRNASSLADDDSGESEAKAPLDDLPSEGTVPATERVVIPMSCASEGEVDVYIEPRLPERTLLVIGCTPIAEALAQLATALDYAVVRVVVDDELRDVTSILGVRVLAVGALREFLTNLNRSECEALVAIVASQGHYDELALQLLDAFDIAFLGLVASRRRGRRCSACFRNRVWGRIASRWSAARLVWILVRVRPVMSRCPSSPRSSRAHRKRRRDTNRMRRLQHSIRCAAWMSIPRARSIVSNMIPERISFVARGASHHSQPNPDAI